MSLGTGLAKLGGKVFRIGHLGHFNDLMLAGTLSGIEMGLKLANAPYKAGGIKAGLDSLTQSHQRAIGTERVAEDAIR
jgi:alanine-glyoxylate transaminase / serine-glyoxylate transaminase / serine-pyruvate transaminase